MTLGPGPPEQSRGDGRGWADSCSDPGLWAEESLLSAALLLDGRLGLYPSLSSMQKSPFRQDTNQAVTAAVQTTAMCPRYLMALVGLSIFCDGKSSV